MRGAVQFQSTPPVRGATRPRRCNHGYAGVSPDLCGLHHCRRALGPTGLSGRGDRDLVRDHGDCAGELHGKHSGALRDYAICEYDYSMRPAANALKLDTSDARTFMVATQRWKLIHFRGGFRPMLFDLVNDPDELIDLGASDAHGEIIENIT